MAFELTASTAAFWECAVTHSYRKDWKRSRSGALRRGVPAVFSILLRLGGGEAEQTV